MEMAQGQISFPIHRNVCDNLSFFFLKDDIIVHTILSVRGQLDGNRQETTNFANLDILIISLGL